MTKTAPLIWALVDRQPGNKSQVGGVVEALGLDYKIKKLGYTAAAGLPNVVRGRGFTGLDEATRKSLVAPWPDLIVAAGRRTAPVARGIKQASKGKTFLCQIMYPGSSGASEFDMICVPRHDGRAPSENFLFIDGAPHRVTSDRLSEEGKTWAPRFADYPKPWIGLIVGGSTRRRAFTEAMAADLGGLVGKAAKRIGGSLLVTTSRRTGEGPLARLKACLSVPTYLYEWGSGDQNPYFGLLALADAVVVTGESVSMCSEAAAAPGSLFIYAPPGLCAPKHRRFHDELVARGHARIFDKSVGLEPWDGPKPNAAGEIAAAIKDRLPITRNV